VYRRWRTQRGPGRPGYDGLATYCPDDPGYSLPADLASVEVSAFTKPYVVGEFGAIKAKYADITRAAYDMRDKQVQSCSVGQGAKGWLFRTYDSDLVDPELANQGQFYSLADGRGAVNGQLAPVVRPDPCKS
jgi:hypothetical protein